MFNNRNFLIHWLSLTIAQTGTFFTIIALPLLVLAIGNNDPVILTSVMAVVSLPNAIFIILGGTLVDKFSPMQFLITIKALFIVVMSILVTCIFLNFLPLWLIYVVAFLLGVLGSIGAPAAQSLLPALVEPAFLQRANALVMGTSQLAQILGPLLVGGLLWLAPKLLINAASHHNIGVAFAIDTIAALFSLLLLFFIKLPKKDSGNLVTHNFFTLFKEGVLYCWHDKAIRTVLFYLLVVSLFLQGPVLAVLPLIIKVKLNFPDSLYGIMFAAVGIGAIIGSGLSAWLRPTASQLGIYVLCCDLLSGASFSALSMVSSPALLSACLLCIGIGSGFITVAGITWIQQRITPEYMGRVMGILMFTVIGLVPLTTALTGLLINLSAVDPVVFTAGAIVVVLTISGLLIKPIRNMGNLPQPASHRALLSI